MTDTHAQQTLSLSRSSLLRGCFVLAAMMGGFSVALQAIAAHLPDHFFMPPHGRSMVHQAADITLWHAIAVCSLCLGSPYLHPFRCRIACIGMTLGMLCFSISVTLHGFGSLLIAPLAPAGGTLLILSWFITASCAFNKRSSH
ncbi:DUF423 domain-containing protein [Saccharibacter sp. 17.LH.SD]|uniref:DUF423 domain-containing protein n=1 Tax=Saccharibacter sp. 17.LH.SD TaxID=2689393 RepID=UPI00137087D0|nr:DUF423 domain-containing protein [Saccharibacter sp. 17.LH.SD]MXV44720.1 DUF423 domain-containing protein [Saccharibacter sp. 17.LH.SD]